MKNPIGNILRSGNRQSHDLLNILSFPVHERYSEGLSKCDAEWYLWRGEGIKDWNKLQTPLPPRHYLLNPALKERQIPNHIDFDTIVSGNKFGNYQIAAQLRQIMHLSLVSIEHTLPMLDIWSADMLKQLKDMQGDINIFISEYSRNEWGWTEKDNCEIIHHGINSERFCPNEELVRKPIVGTVCNDFINRDYFCGYRLWENVTKGLNREVIGDTPNLSKAAPNPEELIKSYQSWQVYINPSRISPIPTSLLEAASCGCGIVSTNNCMIPSIFTHEKDAFLSNNEKELKEYCKILLNDRELSHKMGLEARKTIQKKFSMETFVNKWNDVLKRAANIPFLG